jgi:hypothetical protein
MTMPAGNRELPLSNYERIRRVFITCRHCAANFGYYRAGRLRRLLVSTLTLR